MRRRFMRNVILLCFCGFISTYLSFRAFAKYYIKMDKETHLSEKATSNKSGLKSRISFSDGFSEKQEEARLHVLNRNKETETFDFNEKIVHKPTVIDNVDVNPQIISYVQLHPDETKDPFVNLHSYNFTLNSDVCSSGKKYLVMIIHSAPDYYKKRSLIRATFGSVNSYKGRNITLVFMIGAVDKESLQDSLKEESELFGDIVQGNFKDSYRALVKKHVMAMHWYMSHCVSDYILKLDDDTFVNPYSLMDFLIKEKPSGLGMWCKSAEGNIPLRNPNSKWHTPVSQYPFTKLPQFCLGFAYISTPQSWNRLYTESQGTRMMNMDDVFVGILALRARVKIYDIQLILSSCREKRVSLSELISKAIFLDPFSNCGNLPFKYWKQIHMTEAEQQKVLNEQK